MRRLRLALRRALELRKPATSQRFTRRDEIRGGLARDVL
jgi:hypothetical protein